MLLTERRGKISPESTESPLLLVQNNLPTRVGGFTVGKVILNPFNTKKTHSCVFSYNDRMESSDQKKTKKKKKKEK